MPLIPPALTLYVHYPWCVRKCPYCDFNSHRLDKTRNESAYFAALKAQLEQVLPQVWGRKIHAVFFGGGTPSLMSPDVLNDFLSHARALLGFGAEVEITLEANPGTAEAEKFSAFREAGVNRLSLGVQSFSDAKLQVLGRIHSGAEAHRAIEMAQQAGFENFNIDLMFALPGQTLEATMEDIKAAIAHQPTHLSHYQLTLEPNTPFYRQPPQGLPDDEQAFDMQQRCGELLQAAGFQQYEVSAWARPQYQCRHNVNYWQYGDYIGLGAGAHGKLTFAERGEIWRRQMPTSPGAYVVAMQQGEPGRLWQVDQAERPFEFMLNRLRLFDPFTLEAFEAATGCARETVMPVLEHWQEKGALSLGGGYVSLTTSGRWFINEIVADFMP